AAAALAVAALVEPWAWAGVALMLLLSIAVAAIQALQARISPRYDSMRTRLMVMLLCYAQPLVRSGARYRTRFFEYRAPRTPAGQPLPAPDCVLPTVGRRTVTYWSEDGFE